MAKRTVEYENLIAKNQNKSIEFISHIDDLWISNQLYRFLVNMTKDTKYEVFMKEKGGAV